MNDTANAAELQTNELSVGTSLHDGKPVDLILLPGEFKGTWQKAQAWAEKQGGTLPSRIDLLVLLQTSGQFKPEWYWSGEEVAAAAEYAWCQSFDYGIQLTTHKDGKLRARAVRRVPI